MTSLCAGYDTWQRRTGRRGGGGWVKAERVEGWSARCWTFAPMMYGGHRGPAVVGPGPALGAVKPDTHIVSVRLRLVFVHVYLVYCVCRQCSLGSRV